MHVLTSTVDIRNLRPLKKLPPIDANLQLHVLRAHLQILLWKTNVTHLKKLEILPTLVGTSKAPPSHRPSQQRQLVPKHYWMSLAVAALQSTRHAVAHAAAATAQAFHAWTTANAREETSAVVFSSASRWISKTMKGGQVSMTNKYTLYFLVISIHAYRKG